MRPHQRSILLVVLLAIHLTTYSYAAASDMDLFQKLKRLQQDDAYDERFNEISADKMDNVLFFLSDDSSEKFYTTTTTTTTTEAPETTSEASMDDEYRRMSDLVFRQSRARIALTSTMANLMRTFMNRIFG